MNFRISGQKITTTNKTKYLGILLDEHLSCSQHIAMLKSKLSRANGLLSKVRYYTSKELLRTVYYALFDSNVRYGCQVWGQSNPQSLNDVAILQRKAMRILTFNDRFTSTDPIFKQLKILNFEQIIQSENCILALNHVNKSLPDTFQDFFQYTNGQHNHNTRESTYNKITLPHVKTTSYGLQSIKYKTAKDWNNIQKKLADYNFQQEYLSKSKFISSLKKYYFQN